MSRATSMLTPALLAASLAAAAFGDDSRPAVVSERSGRWSDPATWQGRRVPRDGEAVQVAKGHEITFDVDLDGLPKGLGALTIDGVLRADATRATVLKMAGNIDGGGLLAAGGPAAPLPREASFTIRFGPKRHKTDGQAHSFISAIGRLELYACDPDPKIADLARPVSKGATTLMLDGPLDVRAGELVHVIHHQNNLEVAAIRQYDESTRSIQLEQPLAKHKDAGSRVVVLSRNVRLLGAGRGGWLIGGGRDYYVRAEMTGVSHAMFSGVPGHGSNHEIAGAFYNCTAAVGNGTGYLISGTVTGCTAANTGGGGEHVVSGHVIGCRQGLMGGCSQTLLGEVDRCFEGARQVSGVKIAGRIRHCPFGLVLCSGTCFATASFEEVPHLIVGAPTVDAYGTSFDQGGGDMPSSARPPGSESIRRGQPAVTCFDFNDRPGHVRATAQAGDIRTDEQVAPPPGAPGPVYRFEFVNGRLPLFLDLPMTLTAGAHLRAVVWLRKDTKQMAATPVVQIIDPGAEPLYGGTPLVERTMGDDDGWQRFELDYASAALKRVTLRIVGRNTGGRLWAAVSMRIDPEAAR